MAQQKKVIISLPDNLLEEIDRIVSLEKISRSEFVMEATQFYLREKKKLIKIENMVKGYMEMADINIEWAEISIFADNDQLEKYEKGLGELE